MWGKPNGKTVGISTKVEKKKGLIELALRELKNTGSYRFGTAGIQF